VFNGPLAALCAGVIDEVHDFAGVGISWRELLREPYAGHFNILIATEPKIRNALLLKRLSHDVFISPAANFRFSDRRLEPGSVYPESIFEQLHCLAKLSVGHELHIDPQVRVGPENERLAGDLLPADNRYIGFAPGSAGASKRWPLSRFIQLAKKTSLRGLRPVFFLGPDETSMQGQISAALPEALFPEQSIDGGPLLSIALAARIDVGVANDAGGGHILAAGGRPLISLFGHTSEQKFKPPYGTRVAVNSSDYGGTDMSLIPVERVFNEIELLGGLRRG
jgi:ADP-heptose:LPS heptosyltransferase